MLCENVECVCVLVLHAYADTYVVYVYAYVYVYVFLYVYVLCAQIYYMCMFPMCVYVCVQVCASVCAHACSNWYRLEWVHTHTHIKFLIFLNKNQQQRVGFDEVLELNAYVYTHIWI